MRLFSLPAGTHPVDVVLELETRWPGMVRALRGYLQQDGWDWVSNCSFVEFLHPDSILRVPFLMVQTWAGNCYVWDRGGWRHSYEEERRLAGVQS